MSLKDIKERSEVVIIGTGRYEEELPYAFDLNKTDVWALGPSAFKAYDNNEPFSYNCLFEIHNKKYSPYFRNEIYQEFLKKNPVKKIMQKESYTYPLSEAYPLEEIIEEFGTKFFICSLSYAIALAIHMKYEKIVLRGINMIMTDDLIQKNGVEFWLGIAEGRGIKVETSSVCDLLKCGKMYAYECDNTLAVYQQRYMNTIIREIARYLQRNHEFHTTMAEISSSVTDMFNMLTTERVGFMRQILERHEINYRNEDDENENCCSSTCKEGQ